MGEATGRRQPHHPRTEHGGKPLDSPPRNTRERRDYGTPAMPSPRDEKRIGNSPAMLRVRQLVAELANSAADILIEGETGTGKEMVARCLHESGPRRSGNFVAINCGGLPETLFESEIFGHEAGAYTGAGKRRIGKIEHASGGTLFLDEIESMPMAMQTKLLRVLQERSLNGWAQTRRFRWTAGWSPRPRWT